MKNLNNIIRKLASAEPIIVFVLFVLTAVSASSVSAQQFQLVSTPDHEYNFSNLFNDQLGNLPQTPVITGIGFKDGFIYGGADDRFVYKFNATTGTPEKIQSSNAWVRSVSVSPVKGDYTIAALSQDGRLFTWDSRNDAQKKSVKTSEGGRSLAYAPNGKYIAVAGSGSATIDIFDANSLSLVANWSAPTGGTTSVVFSNYGDKLAAGGRSGTVYVWSNKGQKIFEINLTHEYFNNQPRPNVARRVRAIAFSKDDSLIAIAGDSNTIVVCDAATGKVVKKLTMYDAEGKSTNGKIYSLAFCDNQHLVSGDSLNQVVLWDVVAGKQIGEPCVEHTGTVSSLFYVPKEEDPNAGFSYVLSAGYDTKIIRWRIQQ